MVDSILLGGVYRGALWFRLPCAALDANRRDKRTANHRSIQEREIVDKMLENEKKRGRERKVIATWGSIRAEVYDRKVRGGGTWSALRPLRGTFHSQRTSEPRPDTGMPRFGHEQRKGRWERKKKKHEGNLWAEGSVLFLEVREEEKISGTRRSKKRRTKI